jgi:hypothetical protein
LGQVRSAHPVHRHYKMSDARRKNSMKALLYRGALRHSPVLFLVVALASTGVIAIPRAAAQEGDEIQFNEPVIVTLSPGQTVTRTFTVLPGDTFEVRLSLLAEITYTAVLIDPTQNATPLVPGADGNVAAPFDDSPLSGAYELVLQASAGTGDVLIQVNSDAVTPLPLPFGNTTVDLTTSAIRYELTPSAGMLDTTLELTALTPSTAPYPTLPGYTLVNATTGETAFVMSAGQFESMSIKLPAQQPFLLALEPGETPQQVKVYWGEAIEGATSSSQPQAQPTQSQASQPQPSSSGACEMVFSGAVNIRSGPDVAYDPPIGQVQAGTTLPVTGHDGFFSWYQVTYNGQPGWVSGQIGATQLQGNCNNLVAASYPPLPQGPQGPQSTQQPGVTPTYTYTPQPGVTQPVQPTATYTPSYTPTTEVQIAPPDSNYALAVPLDGTVSLSDVVSYPDGDVEDFIGYSVTGLNQSVAFSGGQADLSFQLQCAGTGSENIVFRIDGQDYACGGTFTRRVNADSNTGGIRITATGGSGTYVQWTVIGSAPRTN